MRTIWCVIAATTVAVGACKQQDDLFCDEDHPCDDPARPFCDVNGEYPASMGVGNQCIPSPFDAGLVDASTPDAMDTPDAPPWMADAMDTPDAPPGMADAMAPPDAPFQMPDAMTPPDAAPDAAPDAMPDAMPTCDSPNVCIEEPPSGWNGPIVFYEGSTSELPPACSGDYPNFVVELNDQLEGGTATCECGCQEPTGISCGDATLVKGQGNLACGPSGTTDHSLPPGSCQSVTSAWAKYYLFAPDVSGGSCSSYLKTSDIPTPTWGTQFRVCEADTAFDAEGCAAGSLCVPSPPQTMNARICIYVEDNVACPVNSAFDERLVRYADYSDTRSCAACSCGDPGGSCGGHAELRTGCGGSSSAVKDAYPGSCTSDGSDSVAAATYYPNPEASCEPSAGQVNGSVSPTLPTTFCCTIP